MRWLRLLPAILIGGCLLSGCGNDMTPERYGQYLDASAKFAAANDVVLTVDLVVTGDFKVYQEIAFGFDPGVRFTAHAIFNASESPQSVGEPDE